MKYLSRSKIYQKVVVNKNAKKLYIFCEGSETEIRYFRYFQGLSSNIDIIPIPSVNGQTDPLKLKANAELLFFGSGTTLPKFSINNDYEDEVWFIIDTDRWNEGNKINQLKSFCIANDSSGKRWRVTQSNPSFEIWLYYHFYNIKPDKFIVETHNSFKQFIDHKITGGFDSRIMPIEIENAISNSKSNFQNENNEQPALYSTEVFYIAEVILSFVKIQIDKARSMILNKSIYEQGASD